MPSTEEWRAVVGYEGLYEVSDQGRVRSLDRLVWSGRGYYLRHGRVLSPSKDRYHCRVIFCRDGTETTHLVHRLVALAFLGPCPEGLEVCHWNGDGYDNRVVNLRYDTSAANKADMARHGRGRGSWTHCLRGHEFTSENTLTFRTTGSRRCRQCVEEYERARRVVV